MKITITVNGKQIEAEVDEKAFKEATEKKKPTGYEKAEFRGDFHAQIANGEVVSGTCLRTEEEQRCYRTANYYSDKNVAINNARADALMRNLRRFAAEHGGCRKPEGNGWMIVAYQFNGTISPKGIDDATPAGTVCFSSIEAARTAITQYYDELNWYFTEYDPMPEGWWDET